MINGDNTMIYPPIKEVVKKLGDDCSRYDLVIAAAKRARVIAKNNTEENKDDKNAVKPITQAVREIMEDDFYIIRTDENDENNSIPDTGDMVINLNNEENGETDEETEAKDEDTTIETETSAEETIAETAEEITEEPTEKSTEEPVEEPQNSDEGNTDVVQ